MSAANPVGAAVVLPFAPTEAALTAAWEAYDAAKIRAEAMSGTATTSRQRMLAHLEAHRLHRAFCKLGDRYDATRNGA